MAVLSGDHATYTHKVDPGLAYRIATEVGPAPPARLGRGQGAAGPSARDGDEALLDRAGLPPAPLTPSPTATNSQPSWKRPAHRLRDRLRRSRRGVCSLAAPVLDTDGSPIGAVSVSSLAALVTEDQLTAFAPAVRQAAQEVSRRL